MNVHLSAAGLPDEITPQPKAHIGGNQVIGFSNSRTADGDGRAMIERYE